MNKNPDRCAMTIVYDENWTIFISFQMWRIISYRSPNNNSLGIGIYIYTSFYYTKVFYDDTQQYTVYC